MTAKKLRVGVLFGGRSGEHEVSLLSAASVMQAIDRTKYEVVPIGITKQGLWLTDTHAEKLIKGEFTAAPRNKSLRAGDPAATSSAAVLAKGEAVIVPPVPSADSMCPLKPRAITHAAAQAHLCRCHLPGAARHLRRRRNPARPARAGRHPLRGLRRARLGRGHGQRHDEAALLRLAPAARQARHRAALRLGAPAQEDREDGGLGAEVPGLREAREPGQLRRHQQGSRCQPNFRRP